MKTNLVIIFAIIFVHCHAQELFVFTEPASNMAAKSIGIRLNNYLMNKVNSSSTDYHLIPEIMVGVSKKIMIHGDLFFSNNNKSFSAEGGSVYAKYRFFSNDDVQKHFRMSAFAKLSYDNNNIYGQDINLNGYNSGWETGIVATQLLHKVALSSGASFVKAMDNGGFKYPNSNINSKAINYTLSFGKLMLPKEYRNYRQTNLNLLLEFLNQFNLGSGKYYIDAAPAIQFIFNSQGRLDIGYRKQLSSSLYRTESNGLFIRLEYNFFNVY